MENKMKKLILFYFFFNLIGVYADDNLIFPNIKFHIKNIEYILNNNNKFSYYTKDNISKKMTLYIEKEYNPNLNSFMSKKILNAFINISKNYYKINLSSDFIKRYYHFYHNNKLPNGIYIVEYSINEKETEILYYLYNEKWSCGWHTHYIYNESKRLFQFTEYPIDYSITP